LKVDPFMIAGIIQASVGFLGLHSAKVFALTGLSGKPYQSNK
jgi:hypothetical protein